MKTHGSASSPSRLNTLAEKFAKLSARNFDGVLLYDSGFVLNATTGVAQLFQRAPTELERCRVSELIARESRPMLLQHLRSVVRTSCPAMGVRADGTRFPIEVKVQAILTLNGRRVQVLALRDATGDESAHHLTDGELQRKKNCAGNAARLARN
jgi:hypothetical protein